MTERRSLRWYLLTAKLYWMLSRLNWREGYYRQAIVGWFRGFRA